METKTAELQSPEKTARERGLRVVAIGGGTGLSTLLKGLKRFVLSPTEAPSFQADSPLIRDLSAVVTVSDDGGSSGRLRRELEMLPPGDIRNCIVALAEDESLLTRLFHYPVAAGKGLKGHSFGNLFLAVLSQITGDFSRAVQLSSEVLAICGKIYPSTTSDVHLRGHLVDGTVAEGETRISRSAVAI